MDFSYNGINYYIEKDEEEPELHYYKRSWLIVKNNPKTDEEYKEIEKLSKLWINTNYLGCEYSDEIKKKLNKLII